MTRRPKRQKADVYKRRGIWRDQLLESLRRRKLTAATFVVGYVMADYMTMSSTLTDYLKFGEIIIYPKQVLLSEQTGFDPQTISRSISQLIAQGHLERVRRGNQRIGSNWYLIVLKEAA